MRELELVPSARPIRVIAGVCVACLVFVVVALVFAPWQQSARGAGRVVGYAPLDRAQTIEAPIEGRIVHWHVREGTHVKKGDPIVDLTDNDPEILARLRQERAALQSRIDQARHRATAIDLRAKTLGSARKSAVLAAQSRSQMAEDRTSAAQHALDAAEAAARTAQLNRVRQEQLFAEGLTSKRAHELAELDAVKTATDVDRARVALSAARAELSAFGSDRLRIGDEVSASIADAYGSRASALADAASGEAELARIEVRLSRQHSQAVVAPRDGTVLRLIASQGTEMVKAGDPLAVLVPETSDRAVELWVDGNDVPLISEGRHVRMQFEGWPAVQFTGWPSVAVGTFGGKVVLIDATDDNKGKFRILVVPDGSDPWPSGRFLRQGTRVEGWVLLDQVKLGYEVWRQFNGFPPVVAIDEAAALKKGDGTK